MNLIGLLPVGGTVAAMLFALAFERHNAKLRKKLDELLETHSNLLGRHSMLATAYTNLRKDRDLAVQDLKTARALLETYMGKLDGKVVSSDAPNPPTLADALSAGSVPVQAQGQNAQAPATAPGDASSNTQQATDGQNATQGTTNG